MASKKKTKAQKKVSKVMREYKSGKLRSGSKKGPKVKSQKQAVAIALSEAGKSKPKRKVKKRTKIEKAKSTLGSMARGLGLGKKKKKKKLPAFSPVGPSYTFPSGIPQKNIARGKRADARRKAIKKRKKS